MLPVSLVESIKPKSYEPGAPFFRSAVKRFAGRRPSLTAVSTKVVWGSGVTGKPSATPTGKEYRIGHSSIDGAKRKAEESVAVGVLLELSADLLS